MERAAQRMSSSGQKITDPGSTRRRNPHEAPRAMGSMVSMPRATKTTAKHAPITTYEVASPTSSAAMGWVMESRLPGLDAAPLDRLQVKPPVAAFI